jgi:signal transduction histidine kinase/HAMP domain-containing protein
MAIARSTVGGWQRRRLFGVRSYLVLAFAAVALLAAGLSFLLSSGSSEVGAHETAGELAVGRTVRLADHVGDAPPAQWQATLRGITDPGYSAWVVGANHRRVTRPRSNHLSLTDVPGERSAINAALDGKRAIEDLPGEVTVVSVPVFRNGRLVGALLARAERPQEIQKALDAVRGDRLKSAGVALLVALILGALIATAITVRLKRLADSAARITEGRFDEPLQGTGGRDEITDLGNSLETMRKALRETFAALSSERDRLAAIFDALSDAVMVVGPDGEVRFSNRAGAPLITDEQRVISVLGPWLRRAKERGSAEHDALPVGNRVYAIGARELPMEGAVLAVVRDRTDELRREVAEREFVSNAAHELRNPIAGISGSVEVLQAGAKDDPEAREHFLERLSQDAERVSRLTESLLTLARIEAVGEGTREVLDFERTIEEAAQAVAPPTEIDVEIDCEPSLAAKGDPVLLRQVLIGLLTNAFKNTPPPGRVTLRARRDEDEHVVIEVEDTGTGIAPEELGRVFERFYRGSKALEQEGFGLGLSIAKRMVDVMGGEIGVRSELGNGTTFWVRLPVAEPAATPVA